MNQLGAAQRRTEREHSSLFFFKRRCLFRQPNACQKELLQQQLSGFPAFHQIWGQGSGGEHRVIASTRQSGSKRRGETGEDGGASHPALARVCYNHWFWQKRTEVTHTPLTKNTQRDDKKDALTVGSIHMQYNVSPSD